jgi:hypothetical protein
MIARDAVIRQAAFDQVRALQSRDLVLGHEGIARGFMFEASAGRLIERVVIHPAEDGLQVEIVGEIVRMVELGLDARQAALPKEAACSVKVVAGACNTLCLLLFASTRIGRK